ncbi:MAG TPA: Sec-independent protein translocase protein TatB [Steroidobacteraceae bacterium]|nr:Sec-independent protein translocase protein TatB [Steroidobacteraceae bacterium]
MLDFGFSEILLTSAIALVVLGPERLPKVARQLGTWIGRARAMARQLSEQLDREISAEELMRQRTRPEAPAAPAAPAASAAAAPASGADAKVPMSAETPSIKPPND